MKVLSAAILFGSFRDSFCAFLFGPQADEAFQIGVCSYRKEFFPRGLVVLVAQWVRHWLAGPVILGLTECGNIFKHKWGSIGFH